jgi:3-oxoadipate enol-lactonase
MPHLEVKGASVYYQLTASTREHDPWVTMVNGYTRTHADFKFLAKKLGLQGYHVLTLDNRGAGETRSESPYTLTDMASDIVGLWDALGVSQSHVLGISMGGILAQVLAKLWNERISRVILVSSAASVDYLSLDATWGDGESEIFAQLQKYFFPDFRMKNRGLIKSMAKQIQQQVLGSEFLTNSNQQRGAIHAYFAQNGSLPPIKNKCLILHGAQDEIIPVNAARKMSEQNVDSVLRIYQQCGHLILAEKPQDLLSDVLSFLRT